MYDNNVCKQFKTRKEYYLLCFKDFYTNKESTFQFCLLNYNNLYSIKNTKHSARMANS